MYSGGSGESNLGVINPLSPIALELRNNGYYDFSKPITGVADTKAFVESFIKKMPTLKDLFDNYTDQPLISTLERGVNEQPHFHYDEKPGLITITNNVFVGGYYQLFSTLLHELKHANQYTSINGSYPYAFAIRDKFGPSRPNTKSRGYLEVEAYEFSMSYGGILTEYGISNYKMYKNLIKRRY